MCCRPKKERDHRTWGPSKLKVLCFVPKDFGRALRTWGPSDLHDFQFPPSNHIIKKRLEFPSLPQLIYIPCEFVLFLERFHNARVWGFIFFEDSALRNIASPPYQKFCGLKSHNVVFLAPVLGSWLFTTYVCKMNFRRTCNPAAPKSPQCTADTLRSDCSSWCLPFEVTVISAFVFPTNPIAFCLVILRAKYFRVVKG